MADVAPASSESSLLASPFSSLTTLSHSLQPHYAALRLIPSRRKLSKSPLYAQMEAELVPLLSAVEQATHAQPSSSQLAHDRLRVVAWNIQRGRRLDALTHALKNDPTLRDADVLLLSEVDCGMARSGNRNVSRELATALRMHYAFGVSYLVLGDDVLENESGEANTLALAGSAVLSRWPIVSTKSLDLPELKDKFSSKSEKRLGKKERSRPSWHFRREICGSRRVILTRTRRRSSAVSSLRPCFATCPQTEPGSLSAETSTPRPTTPRALARSWPTFFTSSSQKALTQPSTAT